MLARLQKMGCELDAMLASTNPALLHPRDAVAVLEAAHAVEQRAASLKTLVADRAADAGTWAREGHRSPEAWLSTKTGTSYGAAAATLGASAKLPELPAVAAALLSTTAMVGARIDAAIEAEADRVFKAAYAEGRREPAGAYRADALENLVTGGGASIETTVVIRVDAERMAGGEGGCGAPTGSVPVDEAIGAILAGAFVKVVLRDGVDVTKVHHAGRHVPTELKTAVFERDGFSCVRPSCGATQRLEVHHYRVDFAKGGATAYWNLATVCSHDHDLITHGGHRIEGGPGGWSWIPPP